jgi:replication factor A1
MSLDEHAEELASSLGVDKAEVKEDLANLVEYSVPIDEAKQSLRRKYGDGTDGSGTASAPAVDSIADITTADGSVSVTARVLTRGKRAIFYDGERQVIREGELADDSGTISYTAWTDVGLEPGDTITVGNAGVREYQGTPELNIGESTTVTVESEPLAIPHQIGGERALSALDVGDRGRTIEVVVESVERKTIDGRDGQTEIKSGVFGDESGRLPFTDWEARPEIEPDATLRVEDVYVREFRGVPEVTVSEFSTLHTLDRPIDVSEAATELSVGEAIETGGTYDVAVVGNVIGLSDGSGLIERCPECNRVVQNGQCRSHGAVDAVDDLRVKAILDDGTGTLTAILDDELTAAVYGGGLDKAREAAREAMDQSVVGEAIAERIVGREYRVRGHLSVDEYGANLDATTFEASDDDPADRAAALLDEIGASTEVAE